ncbi:hypothetical protein [Fluviicola chungangensis]|uniref:Uncharacterized protein n=1 Tax=Fluviicola chungangensis TaxID=2597671 RepID=A0A556N6L1_9FLAO|nr:hypothetical protein [Fluviicola chungangensis]TSJ47812.1 hypothetical protein FO442_01400 [Fluviicola chungangensis]
MFPFHVIGLLTLQFIALIGAFFFKAHVQRHELDKRFQRAGKFLVIAIHVLIVLTIAHAIIYHLHCGCPMTNHSCVKMMHH